MGAARRLRFGLRAPAASAMSVLLLLLPSSLSLALSPPPPPPFFPPQWAPPVAGGGGPFAGRRGMPQDIASQSKGLFGGAFEKQLFGSQLLRIWKSSETQLLYLLAF
uniref:Uncharacterized protein n=1 Tax=Oryza meridionalis TaxID=40149 RepID=A0A0E0CHS0_9ORYZ